MLLGLLAVLSLPAIGYNSWKDFFFLCCYFWFKIIWGSKCCSWFKMPGKVYLKVCCLELWSWCVPGRGINQKVHFLSGKEEAWGGALFIVGAGILQLLRSPETLFRRVRRIRPATPLHLPWQIPSREILALVTKDSVWKVIGKVSV